MLTIAYTLRANKMLGGEPMSRTLETANAESCARVANRLIREGYEVEVERADTRRRLVAAGNASDLESGRSGPVTADQLLAGA